MKKQLLFLALLVFSNSLMAQKNDWIFSIQSNFIQYDIEDDFLKKYVPGQLVEFGTEPDHGYFDIVRKTKIKSGAEIGIRSKIKLFNQFYITSGIEGVFFRFDRVEWIVNQTTGSMNLNPPFLPLTRDDQVVINKFEDGGSGRSYSEDDPLTISQELMFLRVPFNFGISDKSDLIFLYGGMWYAYLIDSQFEKDPKYDYKKGELFSQHFAGLNLGIYVSVFKNFKLKLDYTSSSSNIYAPQYIVSPAFLPLFPEIKENLPKSKISHGIAFGIAYVL